MIDLKKTLATRREEYADALAKYQIAEPGTKHQITRWEILRWATSNINAVLAHFLEPLVALEPAPWAAPAAEFVAKCEAQRAGLAVLSRRRSHALAA